MQTIRTKFLPCTNTKPNRVKASCEVKSITLDWDDDLDVNENHMKAAKLLKDQMGWNSPMVGGGVSDGMVFVFVDDVRID